MQVHSLTDFRDTAYGPFRNHMSRLIEVCGTPEFEKSMFQAARDAAQCEHLTAFHFTPTSTPRAVLAINTGNLPIAQAVAAKYIQQYWNLDPANHVRTDLARDGKRYVVSFSCDEIDDGSYRRDCYVNVGLQQRISLMRSVGDAVYRVNFYKTPGAGLFSPEEMAHIFEASDLVTSLLSKHDSLAAPSNVLGSDVSDFFERRLRLLNRGLPRREIQVCALIAKGLSSEGIALELGISVNTVLTHRKRSYARLDISSQNELMRLLMN